MEYLWTVFPSYQLIWKLGNGGGYCSSLAMQLLECGPVLHFINFVYITSQT